MKPWSHLTPEQKAHWQERYKREKISCVNGVAGWYHQKRFSRNWQRPKPSLKLSRLRMLGEISIPDECAETLSIDDVKDVFA